MKKIIILLGLLMATTASYAAVNKAADVAAASNKKPVLSTRTGNCVMGVARAFLDVNNIRAMLLNSGDMWWDRSKGVAQYNVPKLTNQQIQNGERGTHSLFSGAIWISGKDNGNLKMAAIRFSSASSINFWPGPINNQGDQNIDKDKCLLYDQFWTVSSTEVNEARNNGVYSDNVKKWPGKGNKYLIQNNLLPQEDLQHELAPFYDANGDGIYDYTEGDYPAIKYLDGSNTTNQGAVADQMIFWVLNDIGNAHSVPDGPPIGVQLNCLAFAYATSDEFNNMTFYTYNIYNKSNVDLEETILSQFVDVDLGNALDDYVGCDTVRSIGYAYNADAFDQSQGGIIGYQDRPPVLGVDFFEGPKDDNGNQLGLTSFVYFINGNGGPLNDPSNALEHRNFQEGKTRTGTNLTQGGDCASGNIPTKYCFPSLPGLPLPSWSMCSAALEPKDLRFVQNSGTFTFGSGTKETLSVGVVWVHPPVGAYNGCIVDIEELLFPADEKAQRLFDKDFQQTVGPEAPTMEIIEADKKLYINLVNLPGSNNEGLSFNSKDVTIPTHDRVYDTTYKFEGYLVYQVVDQSISSFSELQDNTKAKLVKKMDLNNDIKDLYEYNLVDGVKVPTNSISFNNSGIEPQFVVTQDLFEQEDQKFLVNEKPYYFAVVAVAYNNFYDSITGESQLSQYKLSNVIKVFTAVPYNSAEYYGIKTNSEFGQKLDVTRITGTGNGSYSLDITDEVEKQIVDNYALFETPYIGGHAPIDVQVNNPFEIIEADYLLTFRDSSQEGNDDGFQLDSSYWELSIDNGTHYVSSSGNIDRPTSTSIYVDINNVLTNYGITINTSTAFKKYTNELNGKDVYKFIEAELLYADSSNKWLQFIKDIDGEDYEDWIRGGAVNDKNVKKFSSAYNVINGETVFSDSANEFGKILDGIIAPYCISANNSLTDQLTITNNYASNGPAFKWRNLSKVFNSNDDFIGEGPANNLDSLFSCDIVITPDKSKWSKCIVLETGESEEFNEFNALKGQLRKAPSRNSDLDEIPGEYGKSFFPGYAINLETGQRVNIYFGENSRARGQGAANMIWDPTDIVTTSLGSPIMGGGHYVYVTNTPYDEGDADWNILDANFNSVTNNILNTDVAEFYKTLIWTFMPIMDSTKSIYNDNNEYTIPSEVKFKLRVQKPYRFFNSNGDKIAEYKFSTRGMGAEDSKDLRNQAFSKMNIVPNPYYAYSIYEANEAQNIVKVTNVPGGSTIKVFTTDGTLVRKVKLNDNISKAYKGANVTSGQINTDNTYTWDLRTSAGVLVSSGVYYVNVEHPDYGSKVLKLFVVMRSPDVSNF